MAPLILIAAEQGQRRERTAEALVRRGFRVARAASGSEALALVARERPAAVVLDLDAGILANDEVERILRSELEPPPVIVALTREERASQEPMVALGAALRGAGVRQAAGSRAS